MSVANFCPAELPASSSFEVFCESYARCQAVLVKGCVGVGSSRFGLEELWELHERWPGMVQKTFAFEHGDVNKFRPGQRKSRKRQKVEPTVDSVLGPDAVRPSRWYASFIVQEEPEALQHTLGRLPCATPPFLQKPVTEDGEALDEDVISHNESAWLFFGQNSSARPMLGRPEHTDKMRHHGTWHVQLSGSKVWYLRATSELLEFAGLSCASGKEPPLHAVHCSSGDVLVVNTRLWWHSTKLPSMPDEGEGGIVSFSYARDFVVSDTATGPLAAVRTAASTAQSEEEASEEEGEKGEESGMGDVNVDGMLAKQGIKKGEVVMMAKDMPKREKPACVPARPNCMVRDLDDGSGEALIAVKDIKSGDLFLVLAFESDDKDPQLMQMRTYVL